MSSSCNDSFLSVGDKSELDIEIEICEELLENEMSNEVECNYSNELHLDNNEVSPANKSNKLDNSELDIELELCQQLFEKDICNEVECNYSQELPVDSNEVLLVDNSNKLDNSDLDVELEMCEQLLFKEHCNEVVSNYSHELPSKSIEISPVNTSQPDVCSMSCESGKDSNLKQNAEVLSEEITWDKCEEDDDKISLFAETDISTLEEFEISILECENAPSITNDIEDEEKDLKKEENDFSNEEEDINDPGWELIKSLSTNEERYKHVRKCWKSSIVPDPNRNLTYHSYRKRHFQNLKVVPKTRKRAATSNLDVSMLNPAKRQRSCTFLYDQNIDSLSAEKDKRKRDLFDEMNCEVRHVNNIFFQQEQRLKRQFEYNGRHNFDGYGQLYNLREKCQREIQSVQQQYVSKANQCAAELQHDINALNSARDEVLNFFNFYKGSNSSDPTVLTTSQLRELDEIENVYSHFDKLYK